MIMKIEGMLHEYSKDKTYIQIYSLKVEKDKTTWEIQA